MENLMIQSRTSRRLRVMLLAIVLFMGAQDVLCGTGGVDLVRPSMHRMHQEPVMDGVKKPVMAQDSQEFFGSDLHAFSPIMPQASLADNREVDTSKMVGALFNVLKNAASLSYFNDSRIIFDIMGNKISLNWGFAGSGDIYEPLKAPTLDLFQESDGNISITSVVKTLMLNGLKKSDSSKVLTWFTNFKFTPLHTLALKPSI